MNPLEELRRHLEAAHHPGDVLTLISVAQCPQQLLHVMVSNLSGEEMLYRIPSLLLSDAETPFDASALSAWLTNPQALVRPSCFNAPALA